MYKLTKLNTEKEEHTELMVELLHIKLCLVILKFMLRLERQMSHPAQENNKNLAENNSQGTKYMLGKIND
jgi:hypothetical protein